MAKTGGYWREAATVILIAKTPAHHARVHQPSTATLPVTKQPFNYQCLLLKRSGGSSFMPEQHVFPGGTLSDSDFDNQWVALYERYTGEHFNKLAQTFQAIKAPAPACQQTRPSTTFPAEIAFRICAIRECFEECGVLLARRIGEKINESSETRSVKGTPLVALSSKDLNASTWRKRVNGNAHEFLSLCLEHSIVPDLWSLQQWSNWLTPVFAPVSQPPVKPKRFDTLFYVCCLDEMPSYARVDGRETTVLKVIIFISVVSLNLHF